MADEDARNVRRRKPAEQTPLKPALGAASYTHLTLPANREV